jgi:hypothetical protein
VLAIAIFTAGFAVTAVAHGKPLHQSTPLNGTWTAGPTKILTARDVDGALWVLGESTVNSTCTPA